jgi:nucleoside-diphosphate-sugar epimerase
VVFGDGEQTRDFTYVANVVEANLLAVDAPDAVGQVMNIGTGERVSLNTLVSILGELIGARVSPEYQAARPGDIHDSVADIRLARRLLGYQPTIALREGLARTVEAFHSN